MGGLRCAAVVARVAVFLDYQNVYRRGRDAFGLEHYPSPHGQIHPRRLGQLLTEKGLGERTLQEVRVYRGQPDATRDPRGFGANARQVDAWRKTPGVVVINRPLRYPANWPTERPQEKGIDVALAVDFVMLAVLKQFDVGILMSVDTDLKPALEAVVGLSNGVRCEVAAWSSPNARRRLSVTGGNIWCHWLTQTDFDSVADERDYNSA
jgi:uncharacterized LabA/DUF88 family protein